MAVGATKVVQVTNIAPQATKDQMQVLFGYLGKIEDIRLYPTIRDVSCPVQSRICYIKFIDPVTVGIAQHMTNTVFIDRALIVIPVQSGEIPDEYYALEMTRNGTIVPGLNVNEPKLPPHIINTVHGTGSEQVIITSDPQLETNGLPNYPPLSASFDSTKVEETRRTILVMNIDSSIITPEDLMEHFSAAGEIKYLRACVQPTDNASHMLVEFSEQSSILNAMKMNGLELKGQTLMLQHATQPITKPQAKSNEAAQKEIEEAMTRFKEAQNMINASIEPVIGMLTKDKRSSRRSRSRSRDRRRRRSRSRSHSRRSRSRRRRSSSRKRSHSRDRRRRSRSRKRSHSRSRRRSGSRNSRPRRSRSRSKKQSRDRSRDRNSSTRTRARSKDRKSRDRSKERKSSKDKKQRSSRAKSKSKERIVSSKDRKSEGMDTDRKRSKSKSRSRSRRRSKSRERRKERRRSRSRGSRRRSPSPKGSRRSSRSASKGRDRDSKKKDKKEKKRDRSKSRDRKSSRKSRSKSRSGSRARRSQDIEKERTSEREKIKEEIDHGDKDSGEKSDNMDISNSP